MARITICDIPIDALTMQETVALIDDAIVRRRPIHHVVVNAAKLVSAYKDAQLRASIANCDIINADGQAIVWASRLLHKPLPERVAGIDLMEQVVRLAARRRYTVFFLGAREEVVRRVVNTYAGRYGGRLIAGFRNGYFAKEDEGSVATQIAAAAPDVLLVAMNSPQKELFLTNYQEQMKTPFCMGVGGSFDVVAGVVKRAPRWMHGWGLEWFYRLIQEPRRLWKRYLIGNSAFMYLVLKEKLRGAV